MEKNKKIYNFEVEILHVGQQGRYQDSRYHYIVKNNCEQDWAENVILDFCQFLHKSYEKKDAPNWAAPIRNTFRKIADRTWEYDVTESYTD